MSKRMGRPRVPINEQAKYNDKIICNICKGSYSRSNKVAHNKTKLHRAFEKINNDIRTLVNTDDEPVRGGVMSVSTFKKTMAKNRIKKKINEMQDENSDTDDEVMTDNSGSEDDNKKEILKIKHDNLRLRLNNDSLRRGYNNIVSVINYIRDNYGDDIQLSIHEFSKLVDYKNEYNERIQYVNEILSQ